MRRIENLFVAQVCYVREVWKSYIMSDQKLETIEANMKLTCSAQ